jgi:hypothetical protein
MTTHLYFGYGIALCGTHLDAENIINEENDGITFNKDGEKCKKCIEAFAQSAQWVLDVMIGKIELPVECTCEETGEENCEKRWYCCDCGREMMHRYGDLFARCRGCSEKIEYNYY